MKRPIPRYFVPMQKQSDSVTVRLDPALKNAIQNYGRVRRIGMSGAVKILIFEALKAQGLIVQPSENAQLTVSAVSGELREVP